MQPLWSINLGAPPRGLALARERGWLLAWDQQDRIHLFERDRQPRGVMSAPASLAAACLADDGSAVAAVGTNGELWFLGPDLHARWQKKLPHAGLAVAVDSFGRYLAASDISGNLLLLDRTGQQIAQTQAARPVRRLAFIPEQPFLIGAADFGLVACFDAKLDCSWRDGLVVNISALAVSGNGDVIAVAGFGPGLHCYSLAGPPHRWQPLPEPCRLVSIRYDGTVFLTSGPEKTLSIVDREQVVRDKHDLPGAAVDIAFAPLGDFAAAVLADGSLLAFAPLGKRK